jgi:hydroxymethylglutaryl-CoA lyase
VQLDEEGFHSVHLQGLVPNLRGAETAAGRVNEMAVFAAATDSFSQSNVNASIAESVARFEPVVEAAHTSGIPVRGYISTAFGCPFEGEVDPYAVVDVARLMLDIGVDTLSIGDTIGVAVPADVTRLVAILMSELDTDISQLGLHFHDTRGMGVANAWAGYESGIRTFDASLGGLGGCPYAPGATGNVATEDLVWMFERSGVETGIDVSLARGAGLFAAQLVGREPAGHVATAPQWDGLPLV